MGVTLTDILLFGKTQSSDVNNGKFIIYRRNILRWGALGGYLDIIVRGIAPLSLPDAVADSLSYVKAFGGTEQGLPYGYTQLQYITFDGTQYIDTGLTVNNNTRALFDVKRSTSSAQSGYPWLGGVRDYVNNTNINKKTLEFSKSDSTRLYLQYATSGEVGLTVPDTTQRHTYDFDKNELYIDENLIYTATQETFMGNATFLIGAMYSQGSIATNTMFYGDVYGFKLWQDGTNLSMNLIPAKRNSDNVVGMYDIVSGRFFTNAGTGTFTAGADIVPTPDAPMDIVSNNGVLKYTPNLLDMSVENIVLGKYINNSGDILDSIANFYNSKYIPVVGGTTYAWSTSVSIRFISFMEYDSSKTFLRRTLVGSTGTPAGTSGSITMGADAAFVLVGSNMTATTITLDDITAVDWQFEKGSSATAYKPYSPTGIYTDGTVETIKDSLNNTATAEMLLNIGGIFDEQEILGGNITRRVGHVVLDGTENWSAVTNGYSAPVLDASLFNHLVCTHFANGIPTTDLTCSKLAGSPNLLIHYNAMATVSAFKAFLASEYANGTPVIVLYCLENETTESVAGQTLQVTDGDNTLEITQASLNRLELEAKYQAVVSLTIQEVQDVNLDPNVEVTIN